MIKKIAFRVQGGMTCPLTFKQELNMRARVVIAVLLVIMLPAAGLSAVRVAKKKEPYWKPLEFGGGVLLDYDWVISQAGRKQQMKLTLEFVERYGYDYDVLATLSDSRNGTVTESRVGDLFSWALAKLEAGPLAPTQQNLPMVSATGLVVPTVMLFFPTSTGDLDWEKGFTKIHPGIPNSTITGTGKDCSSGGLKGKLVNITSPQGTASACISRKSGLPLTMTSKSAAGDFSRYTLIKYESRKLKVPPLFHAGEPDGFGGIKWGTLKKKVKGLKFLRDDSLDGKIYKKKKGNLRQWGVPFETLEYHFWDGKFSQITGKVRGESNWELLKKTLFNKFGNGFMDKSIYLDGVEGYAWRGNDTSISIERPDRSDEGKMTISSINMMWGDTDELLKELFR